MALVDWWAVALRPPGGRDLGQAADDGAARRRGGDGRRSRRRCSRSGSSSGPLLGLVGDVALLGDGEPAFMVGLGAFALGHLAYAVAAVLDRLRHRRGRSSGSRSWRSLLAFRFVTRTVPGARRAGGAGLAGAVVFYACVISAMVVTAWGTAPGSPASGRSLRRQRLGARARALRRSAPRRAAVGDRAVPRRPGAAHRRTGHRMSPVWVFGYGSLVDPESFGDTLGREPAARPRPLRGRAGRLRAALELRRDALDRAWAVGTDGGIRPTTRSSRWAS